MSRSCQASLMRTRWAFKPVSSRVKFLHCTHRGYKPSFPPPTCHFCLLKYHCYHPRRQSSAEKRLDSVEIFWLVKHTSKTYIFAPKNVGGIKWFEFPFKQFHKWFFRFHMNFLAFFCWWQEMPLKNADSYEVVRAKGPNKVKVEETPVTSPEDEDFKKKVYQINFERNRNWNSR